jgi:hypothetical protein
MPTVSPPSIFDVNYAFEFNGIITLLSLIRLVFTGGQQIKTKQTGRYGVLWPIATPSFMTEVMRAGLIFG